MEVNEVEEVEDAEDAEDAAESRLARKAANFGIAARRHYTPRRMNSESLKTLENFALVPFTEMA